MVVTDESLINDWYVVATAQECQPGLIKRVRLLQEDLVLWCSDNPQAPVKVWQDWCPHRGTRLSLGKIFKDRLVCPYHGWQYDQEGQCVHVPSLPTQISPPDACVKTYPSQERWGYIWVCLGNPTQDVPLFPEGDNSDYRKIFTGPYHFHASGFRLIENGFDISHFPFVHGGAVGAPEQAVMEDYDVEVNGDGITISNLRCWQPDPEGTGISGEVTYVQKISRPLTIYTAKQLKGDRRMPWFFTVTPIDHEECLVWICLAMNYGHDIPEPKLVAFQDELYREDALIVESQRPLRLPLLSKTEIAQQFPSEVHTRCDRVSLVYRRWLQEMGITFGVC